MALEISGHELCFWSPINIFPESSVATKTVRTVLGV